MSTTSSISVSYFNKYKKQKEIPKTTSKIYSSVENNIIDIKNFYLNYLISILRSSLIDGINSLFDDIIKTKDKNNICSICLRRKKDMEKVSKRMAKRSRDKKWK